MPYHQQENPPSNTMKMVMHEHDLEDSNEEVILCFYQA
jgi:hypothetical protein